MKINVTSLFVDNNDAEYERLKAHGIKFTMEPTAARDMKLAVFNDTCGNLIQPYQKSGKP